MTIPTGPSSVCKVWIMECPENFRTIGPPVLPGHANTRLDLYLARHYPFCSRSQWRKRIEEGRVVVGGAVAKASAQVRAGDQILMFQTLDEEPEADTNLRILWEEGSVKAIYKPGGLPMHQNGPYRTRTFDHVLRQIAGPEWSAVHRLDLETSGIVLCGSTALVRQNLSQQLVRCEVRKEYHAIVRGQVIDDNWLVEAPIGDLAESAIRIKKWVQPDGQYARTEFSVMERGQELTLIKALPRTGRTNQIRIHSAYSGFPLLGDKLYHPDEQVFLDYFENGNCESVHARTGHRRLCLHAAGISFIHPETNQPLSISCPIPDDMQEIVDTRIKS